MKNSHASEFSWSDYNWFYTYLDVPASSMIQFGSFRIDWTSTETRGYNPNMLISKRPVLRPTNRRFSSFWVSMPLASFLCSSPAPRVRLGRWGRNTWYGSVRLTDGIDFSSSLSSLHRTHVMSPSSSDRLNTSLCSTSTNRSSPEIFLDVCRYECKFKRLARPGWKKSPTVTLLKTELPLF